MAPLAKLPVFFDLAGKRAVIAGGSAAAAWKAELLVAAGAVVDVYATALALEMAELAERHALNGSLVIHDRAWTPDIFAGAVVAIADLSTPDDAKAFHDAALAAGVPVNLIDQPELSSFQFGSIVNRSPVVISISTDGAAPILAQTIRRRIETMLPATLGSWASLAKRIRQAVMEKLALGSQRRSFWEHFANKAFGPAPTIESEHDAEALLASLANSTEPARGRVTLVGAGPGDAELLTLKAVRALQSADVILFDDLVSNDVLELARREARRMLVGKRGGRDSCRQEDINALMIKLARQGKHVVRLKSGDPMIFGRAGEEIAELDEQGIPVAVVPGISSGMALASELGVSLTHRDYAHSVRFVTGHARSGQLPDDLDWKGLADPETTVIFYMGGRTAPAIATRLIDEGLPETTPVAIAKAIGRPEYRLERMTLAGLQQETGLLADGEPVLLGIGQAFATRKALDLPKYGAAADHPEPKSATL